MHENDIDMIKRVVKITRETVKIHAKYTNINSPDLTFFF